jgi:hypothetical protein
MCGVLDNPHAVEGEYDNRGDKKIEHSVTIELRYLTAMSQLTGYLKSKGWKPAHGSGVHQGRSAIERQICRACLLSRQEMEREFKRKRDREVGLKNHDPYYMALCGD